MRIKKTATEIKQEALMRKYKRSKITKQQKKAKKLPYETPEQRNKMTYYEYLQSKYWKLVRKKVLARDGNACVVCKATKWLQVHHDNYKHVKNELKHLGDLMTLCKKCHTEHHYAQP